MNAAVKGLDDDKIDSKARFQNVHYFAAGASLFGDAAQVAYQYDGKKYVGQNAHVPGFDTCTGCHNTHELEPRFDKCVTCHAGAKTPQDIRMSTKDYDGNKDVKEGISVEVASMEAKLYDAIKAYSKEITKTGIAYNAAAYPYFFIDTNGDGKADEKEAVAANAWADWTPRLLRAAYNFQYVQKDPGIFAHNPKYAIQIIYDALEDLGKKAKVDLTGLTSRSSSSSRCSVIRLAGDRAPHWCPVVFIGRAALNCPPCWQCDKRYNMIDVMLMRGRL